MQSRPRRAGLAACFTQSSLILVGSLALVEAWSEAGSRQFEAYHAACVPINIP